LAIDWEQQTLRIVSANTKRGAAVIERGFELTLDAELTAENGEAVGRKLRDALKAQGIAAAPVVVCLGRDRMLVKDIEHPAVSEMDEPGLVRLQATKHLADGAEELAIDYMPLGPGATAGSRQALIVAIKRSLVTALQALCRGAGLKLAGMTGRPLALIAALDRHGVLRKDELCAVLGMGSRWSEFCVARGYAPLMARSLATGPNLGTEVQRNLTLFSTRTGSVPATLFVCGCEGEAQLGLLTGRFPGEVRVFHPHAPGDAPLRDPERYDAAVGLAHLCSLNATLPINWAAPKQPRVAANRRKEWGLAASGIGALALLLLIVFGWRTFSGKRQQIDVLKKEHDALVKELKAMEEDVANNDALRDWEDGSISWLDELYDLSARFPHEIGLHLNHLSARVNEAKSTAPGLRKEKSPFIASIDVRGVVPPGKDSQVERLQRMIQQDKHLRIVPGRTLSSGAKPGEFEFKIEVSKATSDVFTTKLEVPKQPASTPMPAPPEKKEPSGEEGGSEP
jgi:hypothetical protein